MSTIESRISYNSGKTTNKTLGREIVIPADAKLASGIHSVQFIEKTYELTIGIGKNHTATLFIGEDALKELATYKHEIHI